MAGDLFFAFGISLIAVLILGIIAIPFLHKLKFGQSIREEGPKSHQKKSGTPTMGGIFLIAGIVIGTLINTDLDFEIGLALFIMLGHFVLGFIDDYRKVVRKQNLGLKAREKLIGQILISMITLFIARSALSFEPTVWIPILNEQIDIGAMFYPFILFIIVGASNAVNLTDRISRFSARRLLELALDFCDSIFILPKFSWATRDLSRWEELSRRLEF